MSRYNKLFEKGIFSLHRTILEDELIKELAGYFNVLSDRLAKIQKNYPENMHLRGTISGAVEELIEFFTFAFINTIFNYYGTMCFENDTNFDKWR